MHPNIGSSDCNEKLASFDTDVTPTPKFLNFFMSQIFFAILDPTQKGGRVFWEKNPKIFFFKNLHVDIWAPCFGRGAGVYAGHMVVLFTPPPRNQV